MNNAINLNISTNYYPFGSLMPSRHTSSADYRYGFNGKEMDDEIKGSSGTQYDYGFRMYNSRLGRWLSTDTYEKEYTPITPYGFALNNPIKLIDVDGNVVTDENGNPVTITVTEGRDGAYNAAFKFAEGTSQDVIDNFKANGGRVIKTLIQVPSGREIVAKAEKSEDNIHITISPKTIHTKEKVNGGIKETARFGKTTFKRTLDFENKKIKREGFEVEIYEGTINSVSNDNTSTADNKKLYIIDNLNQDQKVAITGAHELDHATSPEQVTRMKEELLPATKEQHKQTRDFEKKVSGEFGTKNSEKK